MRVTISSTRKKKYNNFDLAKITHGGVVITHSAVPVTHGY